MQELTIEDLHQVEGGNWLHNIGAGIVGGLTGVGAAGEIAEALSIAALASPLGLVAAAAIGATLGVVAMENL
jgi:hypothetical protein